MKTLVCYSSLTGNTKKIADVIFETIGGEKELIELKEGKFPNYTEYDNIIIGYWADKGKANYISDMLLREIKNKNVGVFATLGAYPDSEHGKNVINYGVNILKDNNCNVIASFICQGKVDPKLIERRKNLEPGNPHYLTEERKKRLEIASLHPNEEDFEMAKRIFSDFTKLAFSNDR